MSELELLGIGRAVLAATVLVFALRGRYWWLFVAGCFGLLVSVLVSLGYPPIVTARLAYGLYFAIAMHAVLVTRRRNPRSLNPKVPST